MRSGNYRPKPGSLTFFELLEYELNEFITYEWHVAGKEQNGIHSCGFQSCVNSAQRSAFWDTVAADDADWETRGARSFSNVAKHGCGPEAQAGFVAAHAFA
jgi:hypothetical protein